MGVRACGVLVFFLWAVEAWGEWRIAWEDEFDGTALNTDTWYFQSEAHLNNEAQCYVNEAQAYRGGVCEVSDGTLKIRTVKTAPFYCPSWNANREYKSVRLNTKNRYEFMRGKVEVRLRMGSRDWAGGLWPTVSLLGTRINEDPIEGDDEIVVWPNPGAEELNIWEWVSRLPHTYTHSQFCTGGCGSEESHAVDVCAWHTVAAVWEEGKVRHYFNGEHWSTVSTISCDCFNSDRVFVLLGFAVGGNTGGTIGEMPWPQTLEVDYVRHYTWEGPKTDALPVTQWRVNCGGPACTARDGAYEPDDYFEMAGQGGSGGAGVPISNTEDDALYQSERWGAFTYNRPVVPGTYTVTLKFAETFWSSVGKRVFNVTIEGKTLVTNLDLVAAVGTNAAYNVVLKGIEVSDGTLTISGVASRDKPTISAISAVCTRRNK